MKYIYISLLLIIISSVSSVDVDIYYSETNQISTNSYQDLSGLKAECPNYGAMKNFKVIVNNAQIGYQMICYSSKIPGTEYDESVLKTAISSSSLKLGTTGKSLELLTSFKIECPVDFAINSFSINVDGTNTIVYFTCVNVKPTTETKDFQLSTESISTTDLNSYDALTKITCGSSESESEELRGVALRGFQLITSKNIVSYKYDTLTLKNVENLKKKYIAASSALRDNNTQKN